MNKQSHKTVYRIEGVSVDKYTPATPGDNPAIVMVHGGEHGSWCWGKWAEFFCEAGYEVHALNWYNHGDSDKLPEEEFIKRSIIDVAHEEIPYVIEQLDKPPILIGHSMGGLASAAFATNNNVERLALITPVMPAVVHPDPVPLPIDLTKPFPAFSYPQAKEVFYTTLNETEAREYTARLVPESPQAAIEATQWTVEFDPTTITAPTFVMGAELDRLIPIEPLRRYAQILKAEYKEIPAIGHCDVLLKEPQWREAAELVHEWLEK